MTRHTLEPPAQQIANVPVRIVKPAGAPETHPAVLYVHGSGRKETR